jgi:uncharacterized phage protein (TIGR02218 family)
MRSKNWCHLFQIKRKVGVPIYLTDNPHIVNFNGEDYMPSGGGTMSAEQREAQKESNFEVLGFLDSTAITAVDINAGRYQGAELFIWIVDPRRPHRGFFYSGWKQLEDLSFTGSMWRASVVGRARKLQKPAGRRFLRDCDYVLGNADTCRVNLSALDYIRTAVEVESLIQIAGSNRLAWQCKISTFAANNPASTGGEAYDDDFFREGEVTFTTGANIGITRVVSKYTHGTRRLQVYLPFPFDIAVDDQFTLKAGCDGTMETCKDKFENLPNHGGDPHVPGTQASLAYPDN